MIGAYDHANTGFVTSLLAACGQDGVFEPDPDLAPRQAIESLKDCDPVLCHVGSDLWEHLCQVNPRGTLIRVSSLGWSGMSTAGDPDRQKSGRYVLHLWPRCDEPSELDWRLILDTVRDAKNCQELVTGGNPNGTRGFFSRSGTEYLAALSILCQGYLAVAASADGGALDSESVRQALKAMGWLDYSTSQENAAVVEALAKGIPKVSTPEWWIDCLRGEKGDASTVRRNLLSEWSGLAPQGAASENLETLLRSLGCRKSGEALENREATGGEISGQVVADVYLELGKILGGAAS